MRNKHLSVFDVLRIAITITHQVPVAQLDRALDNKPRKANCDNKYDYGWEIEEIKGWLKERWKAKNPRKWPPERVDSEF